MDILSAFASINAIIIALLISLKKQKSISEKILIAWVLNFAFLFAIPFCIEHRLFFHESYWGFLLVFFIVAHSPFIFVYTSSLTKPEFKFNFKYFYHFGFILIISLAFIPYLLLSPEERMNEVLQKEDLSYYSLLPMLTLLFIQIYFLTRTIIILVRHQDSIRQSYSYVERVSLAWIKLIVFAFLGIIILGFIGYGLVSAKVISVFWMDYFQIIAYIIVFFYIAFYGYRQTAVNVALPVSRPIVEKETKTDISKAKLKTSNTVPTDDKNEHISKLLEIMENEKLYLDPELHITSVAIQLKMHTHQLSKLINIKLQKNFFEFVNEYRVKEFKKLVANPKNKHISLLGLAMDAGFNSKASFNRIFKNSTGLTPSEFKANFEF